MHDKLKKGRISIQNSDKIVMPDSLQWYSLMKLCHFFLLCDATFWTKYRIKGNMKVVAKFKSTVTKDSKISNSNYLCLWAYETLFQQFNWIYTHHPIGYLPSFLLLSFSTSHVHPS